MENSSPSRRRSRFPKAAALPVLVLAAALAAGHAMPLRAQDTNTPKGVADLQEIHAADLEEYANKTNALRVAIKGVAITEFGPGCWFVYEGDRAFRVHLKDPSPLKPGDAIITTGKPIMRTGRSWLEESDVVVTGQGTLPAPKKLAVRTALYGAHDGEYVMVKGEVLGYGSYINLGATSAVIQIASDDNVFCKIIMPGEINVGKLYPGGTVAEFTGVCRHGSHIDGAAEGEFHVHVVVHGTDGVKVVWTKTASRAVAGAVAVLICAVVTLGLLKWRKIHLLRGSELRFRALIENSFDIILVLNRDLSMKYVSPSAQRFVGSDWKSKSAVEVIHPEDRPMVARLQEGILASPGHTQSMADCRLLAQDGGVIYVEAIVSNCLHLPGVEGIVVNVRDVNERKRAEEKLRRLNADLEKRVTARTAELKDALAGEKEINRLKTNFTSMVTHEIRTPLEIILSSAEILLRYLDRLTPEKRILHLQTIRSAVQQMSALMQDVLLSSRVEAGRMEFNPASIDLPVFCAQLVDELASATNRRCPIELSVAHLEEPARADENLLRHIFTNLLSNAVKYSPAGEPVKFTVTRDGGSALFLVQDSGIGIPDEDRRGLFTPFYRGKNVSTIQGTGLGLVIVKHCVEFHGGSINIQSAPASGTTVTIRLPLFSPAHTEFVQRLSETPQHS